MKATILLLGGLLSVSLQAQDFDYSFRENYTVSTPAQLFVSSSDGNIEVLPGNGNEIQVYFIVRKNNSVLDISRAELEEELTVTVVKTGNSLDVTVKYPDNYWSFDFSDRISVDFKIYTPTQTACDLRTSDGNIFLTGVATGQKLRTSDGDIRAEEINGDLSSVTSDGNIQVRGVNGSVESITSDGDIDLRDVEGGVRTRTSDGNIELTHVRGDHYAHTSDGDVYFTELYGSLDAETSDGNIKGNIVALKGKLRAKTSDGNIEVSVPGGTGMNLYVKGESIDVPLQNFSGRSSEDLIDGQSNGGGVDVNLSTSDGSIKLVYR